MSSHPRVRLGDVVAIPVSGEKTACAQVLVKRKILYVSVFSRLYPDPINVADVLSDTPALAGWTMDAKIYHGDWKILGNASPKYAALAKRKYLVEYEGNIWVQDLEGKLEHVASRAEADTLFPKSSYSPVRLERAIRAFHGMEPWCSDFDDLVVHP